MCVIGERERERGEKATKSAVQAAAVGIEVMGAMGIGSDWGAVPTGGVGAEEFGRRMARAMAGSVTHWQMSDEWAVPHCMLPRYFSSLMHTRARARALTLTHRHHSLSLCLIRVDYKRHWGMDKEDYNASCTSPYNIMYNVFLIHT